MQDWKIDDPLKTIAIVVGAVAPYNHVVVYVIIRLEHKSTEPPNDTTATVITVGA